MWDEYDLVIEKKLNIWNELLKKTIQTLMRRVLGFCREEKGKRKNINSLKSDTGLSLTSTRGKLEVLQKHYQHLGKMSVDSVFADWKEVGYSSL